MPKAAKRAVASSKGSLPSPPRTTGVANERATRTHHPSSAMRRARHVGGDTVAVQVPPDVDSADVVVGSRSVRLTNLGKVFWPEIGLTKRDLLQYYADVAPALLPHVADRAMVMKRYPNGAAGEFFFMKRTPSPRPEWLETCSIEHASGNVIDFPMVQDVASLLWVVNLGCIDLNQWYARCDDVDRPDYLHFDLDPVPGATFADVRATAFIVREALDALGMRTFVKTTGSRGLHVYVPIVRGPTQRDVWTFAKGLAQVLAAGGPMSSPPNTRSPSGRATACSSITTRMRGAARSPRSTRHGPRPTATVSTPITWEELEAGASIDEFTIANVPARIAQLGDLWAPLNDDAGRFELRALLQPAAATKRRRSVRESTR